MNKNIYYLPIQSTSLSHYFGKALILPSRFYKKRPADIQNINSDYLVLSKKKLLNNSNCSIELILESEELKDLIELGDNNTFLYSNPIPISRVKKVYFIDEVQKLKTIDNINRGTAFIPKKLVEVITEENINVKIEDSNSLKYSSELEAKIKTYNQVLGGIAFVQYTYEGKYSKNYYFNNYIYDKHTEKQKVFKGYDGAFTYKGKVWDKLSPLIYKSISDDYVYRQAKEENIVITKSLGLFNYEELDNISSLTYELAILNTYGEDSSKRKKTNALISDCKNGKIPEEKQEDIALIFGINNGYSSFRNQYDKKIVKFKMESLLDYYTIESVFQYVINEQKDNQKFEYIDSLFPDEGLVLDIGKKAFDLEECSKSIFNYFKENILNMSLKELFSNGINKFKNTVIEEMDKKNSELENMKLKIKELEKEKNNFEKLNKEKDQNINSLENKIKKQNKKINKVEDDKKDLNKELQDMKNSIKHLEQQNKVLNQNIQEKEDKINSIQKNHEITQNKLTEKVNIIVKMKKENSIKDDKINSLENEIKNLEQALNKATFDEEKERIIVEQTLESYLKYDSKKAPELKKIAKEKGIKYTKKTDTIKSILTHKEDNRLL